MERSKVLEKLTPNFCRIHDCDYSHGPGGDCYGCKYNLNDNSQDDDLCGWGCEDECIHCGMIGGHSDSCICNPIHWGSPFGIQFHQELVKPYGLNINERNSNMGNIIKVLERDEISINKLYGVVTEGRFDGRVVLITDIVTGEKAQEMLNEDKTLGHQCRNISKKKEYLVTLSFDNHHTDRGQVWRTLRDITVNNSWAVTGLIELSKKHEKHLLDFSEADKDYVAVAKAIKARLKEGFPSVFDELAEVLGVEDAEVKDKLSKSPRLQKIIEKLDLEID